MPYSSSVSYDSVQIIESLPEQDLTTGRELLETTLAPAACADVGFLIEYREARNRREFFAHLQRVIGITEEHSRFPVLHLETHGSREGLLLSSGERVSWEEVAPSLARLNELTRANLLVVAAMCHGWHLSEVLRPTDRSPAFGIVGTTEELAAGAILDVMKEFYACLVSDDPDLSAALASANAIAESHGATFRMEGAELMFCRVFRAYLRDLSTGETQPERVNRLVAVVARAKGSDLRETMQIREQIREALDDHPGWYERYRSHFLLLDLFPENEKRFTLTYDRCMKIGLSPSAVA